MGMDHYTRLRDLGGQNGAFLAADKQDTSKRVVIKRLGDLKQGMAELSASLQVQNANIVPVLESFIHDGALYVVVEYQSGGDVAELVQRMRRGVRQRAIEAAAIATGADSSSFSCTSALAPRSVTQLLQWFIQLLRAVAYCHEQCIIHRDIKPGNIFVSQDTTTLYLGDFGSAKSMQSSVTTETFVGSPLWLSPEVLIGMPYTYSSDIWALGCVFYELATLRRPFAAVSLAELVTKVTRGEVAALPATLPAAVHILISRMLTNDAAQRPTAAEALQMAVEALNSVTCVQQTTTARHATSIRQRQDNDASVNGKKKRTTIGTAGSNLGGGVRLKHPCSAIGAAAATAAATVTGVQSNRRVRRQQQADPLQPSHGSQQLTQSGGGTCTRAAHAVKGEPGRDSVTNVESLALNIPSPGGVASPLTQSQKSSHTNFHNSRTHQNNDTHRNTNASNDGSAPVSSRRGVRKNPPSMRAMHGSIHMAASASDASQTKNDDGENDGCGYYSSSSSGGNHAQRRNRRNTATAPTTTAVLTRSASAASDAASQPREQAAQEPQPVRNGGARHEAVHSPAVAHPSLWLAARSKDVAAIETYLEQFRSYDTTVLTPEPPCSGTADECACAQAAHLTPGNAQIIAHGNTDATHGNGKNDGGTHRKMTFRETGIDGVARVATRRDADVVAGSRSAPRRRRSVSADALVRAGVDAAAAAATATPSQRFHRLIPAAPSLPAGVASDESGRSTGGGAAALMARMMMSRATPQRRRSPTPSQQAHHSRPNYWHEPHPNPQHTMQAIAASFTRFATAPRTRVTASTASPFVRQRSAQSHLTRPVGSHSSGNNHHGTSNAAVWVERAPVLMAHGQRQASYANVSRAPSCEERAMTEQEREAARARREEERSQMKMRLQEQRARVRKDHKEQEPMIEIHLPNKLQYNGGEGW